MGREPAISFRGAMRILGHYERKWVDRLDRLLGGVILGAGTEAAIFGWVDQKNEATGLLRTALDTMSNRVLKTGGLARHELVVAAHTTMVLAAFWEILAERMGDAFRDAEFTKAEKVRLATGRWQRNGESLVRHLFDANIPAPSAVRGFEENVEHVEAWAHEKVGVVSTFLYELDLSMAFMIDGFAEAVASRYRADYLVLAAKVPEFKVWADLGEHSATRAALSRLEDLLTTKVLEGPRPELRGQLRDINRAELSRPIIDVDIDGYGINAVFPAVRDIFVDPHYVVGNSDKRDDNLDVVLARHFSTPDATRVPLLLLGHPGAGKSLLMKVLAARLPEPTYTVVRVPLRRVNADANVVEQIQQGLLLATNGNVTWPALTKECDEVMRVVLLDGLDELLQATTNDRGGYLADVLEFQRVEAALGHPVAVVVTSRTLVADRVRIPRDTPVVELLEFDDAQIEEWITAWNAANPNIRSMTLEIADAHSELAQQPLLLLMLTLYFADPDVQLPGHDLSTAELYERLLETYARREVTKQAGRVLPDEERAEAVRTQLNRLAAAALGMFNRGRQSITETELTADLAALGDPAPAGRRVLGEFFFVHAPEAGDQRGYEFLHATFAEYLVATRVVEILTEVAEGSFGRRRFHEPDDELLFALLSHQPLAIQGPVLDFILGRLATLDDAERADVIKTLDLLIPTHRSRPAPTRHLGYQPSHPDAVRALAAYSANLVLIRLLADLDGAPLSTLFPGGQERTSWRATVQLWSAGLDVEGFRAVVSAIKPAGDRIAVGLYDPDTWHTDDSRFVELNAAVLRGDDNTARRLRLSHAIADDRVHSTLGGTWRDEATNALLNCAMGYTATAPPPPPAGTTEDDMLPVASAAYNVLGINSVHWDEEEVREFLEWLLELPVQSDVSPLALALADHIDGELLQNLRDRPGNKWSQGAIDLLDRAIDSRPDNIGVIFHYLRAVLLDEWELDFIKD